MDLDSSIIDDPIRNVTDTVDPDPKVDDPWLRAIDPDPLVRIEAKLDAVLDGIARMDKLVDQAGPALAELGGMAERMASGGIMSLLKGK